MEKAKLLAEFILQSDLIEYINDSRTQLENEICSGKPDGHVGAILYLEGLAKKQQWLTEEIIKKVQGLITKEQGVKRADLKILAEYVGNYRDVPVSISGEVRLPSYDDCSAIARLPSYDDCSAIARLPSCDDCSAIARLPPSQIPCKMRALISRTQYFQEGCKNRPELANIAAIADFYFDFEMYHPFYDGNGRTGRAIVFFLMSYLGRTPFIFTNEEKYYMHFPALKNKERLALRKYFYEKSGLV